MDFFKKGMSPVVAIALLLVVSVVAVVGYQQWYQGYQSILTSDVETRSTSSGSINIEYVSSDGTLYVTNSGTENVSMSSIEVAGVDCDINEDLVPGVNKVDISSCLSDTGTNEVMIVTDSGIIEESLFVEELSLPPGPIYFTSVWDTTLPGSASDTIVLPLEGTGTYNFTIYWGDGSSEDVVGIAGLPINHTYVSSGIYEINITGEIVGWRFANFGDDDKIIDIKNWGPLRVGNSGSQFSGCSNLNVSATDALNLTGTTNLAAMFSSAVNFNSDISHWDVSEVINMAFMFDTASNFNQDLSSWDTGNVVNMQSMFEDAVNFNQDIDSWDVSNVGIMWAMFKGASKFNQDLNNWDMSNVSTTGTMFSGATLFNGNISDWNTSNVNDFWSMFYLASNFNQDIGGWNTSKVTATRSMFANAIKFNQDISGWDVGKVENMDLMFQNANLFNQNLSTWDTSSVTTHNLFDSGAGSWTLPRPTFP